MNLKALEQLVKTWKERERRLGESPRSSADCFATEMCRRDLEAVLDHLRRDLEDDS